LAVADSLVPTNQAIVLTVPKVRGVVSKRTATPQQVAQVIRSLEIRDRLIVRLAFYVGFRPGEICALQWKNVAGDQALIDRRVYRGKLDTVKNNIPRTVALPSTAVKDFALWRHWN
jgi:integrase